MSGDMGSKMSVQMAYFEDDDILHIAISEEPEAGSVELAPNITAELNANGELIGIEILNASEFIRDTLLETVQARMLTIRDSALPLVPAAEDELMNHPFAAE